VDREPNAPIQSKGPGTGLTAAANDAFQLSLRHMQTVIEASLRQTRHPGRLCSVMSTRTDSKHGHRESGTEVPRDKLVNALRSDSELRSTQELEPTGDLVLKLEFDR
jgi:hypothetical protein